MLEYIIAPLSEAQARFRFFKATHAVSILDPGQAPPDFGLEPDNHLILRMRDRPYDLAELEDRLLIHNRICWLVDFIEAPPQGSHRLLLHCHDGIRLSPAFALIADLARRSRENFMGAACIQRAIARLRDIHPPSDPNPAILTEGGHYFGYDIPTWYRYPETIDQGAP